MACFLVQARRELAFLDAKQATVLNTLVYPNPGGREAPVQTGVARVISSELRFPHKSLVGTRSLVTWLAAAITAKHVHTGHPDDL
mmetsp:Transcript_2994/g.6858  ORF Transcript_2994/g.6858 Transcript_2994/m.6858 type:complete len:85 (-) Transcript_2994:201-455(-)